MRYRLLASTLEALLEITCGPRGETPEIRVLHKGEGVYFGLTLGVEAVYFVARNLSLEQIKGNLRAGTNQIYRMQWLGVHWSPAQFVTHLGPVADLHQIRYQQEALWMVSPREPHVIAVELGAPDQIWRMNLDRFIPAHLQHPPRPGHHGDIWHFNSLHFPGDALWILAHNWEYGAFALEFENAPLKDFFRAPKLRRVIENLGHQSHDVYDDGNGIWLLDSGGSYLIHACSSQVESWPLQLDGFPASFPRGLAADAQRLFIGCGTNQEQRALRQCGESHILILDRDNMELTGVVELGKVGDVCDLLLIEPADLTD